MTIVEIILLAVALAMDCFTVSVVSGIVMQRRVWPVILQMSVLFGVFQALMPLIGWALTAQFASYIEAYDHWIAFALLLFLGLKMVRDAFLPDNQQMFDPTKLKTQLTLAVATSIDALTVGISMSMIGYDEMGKLLFPLTVIGVTSLLFGITGHLLGISFGRVVSRRVKPGLLGGVLLVIIGIKVLLTHLC